jgi:hypothetical protein
MAQGSKVPGNRWLWQAQTGLQFAHAQRAAPQELQDFQPHGFAGRLEQGGEF